MSKNYEGFTLGLAIFDALPVLLFGASMLTIGLGWGSPLFLAGAGLAVLAGMMKVTWKLILGATHRDVTWLNRPFRYLMAAGFLLMLAAVIAGSVTGSLDWRAIGAKIIALPQVIFFALWLLGLTVMGVLGKKLDSSVARNNWIEQSVNTAAQLCGLIGILLSLK